MDKKNHWIHVYSAGDITLKLLHQKRGKEAVEEFWIIPAYGGVIVHDCWASYLAYEHLKHGLCGSHLLRELQFAIDANGYRWAKNMKRLLRLACKMVSTAEDLRMTKVKQKISGCFRTEKYAKTYCRISSYMHWLPIMKIYQNW